MIDIETNHVEKERPVARASRTSFALSGDDERKSLLAANISQEFTV
uniref:Relaxosome protein TraY n=1 Tax=Heterorhabditis bacteriophora TaxID=37862 RepID=A0A1I7W7Y6_HETBA